MFQRLLTFVLISTFFSTIATLSIAQNRQKHQLNWTVQSYVHTDGKTLKKVDRFDNAIFDYRYPSLPIFAGRTKGNYTNIDLQNEVYEAVSTEFTEEQKKVIEDRVIVQFNTTFEQKQPYLSYAILPYRKNSSTGKIERLVSFELSFNSNNQKFTSNTNSLRTYASNSVLNTGNWYKMGVSKTGVYKLSYDELEKLGMNPSGINPKNIRIYGNGGGIIPESNAVTRYDDLQENAIQVFGEDDGRFDKGDYLLFYGFGPNMYVTDTTNKQMLHVTNTYTLENFYFITSDLGPGKRMSTIANSSLTPNKIVDDFNTFELHELNANTGVNQTIKSGRERYGEEFGNVNEQEFKFKIPNIVTTKPLKIRTDLIGRSQSPTSSQFKISYNNQLISTLIAPGVEFTYDSPYGSVVSTGQVSVSPAEDITVKINYIKTDFTAVGFLNFILVNAYRKLIFDQGQLAFRNIESYGAGKITRFNIQATDPINTSVWDVTDKVNVGIQNFTTSGNTIQFTASTNILREYCLVSGSNFESPRLVGRIENQNLHALGFYDFIIVSHPDFESEAKRLANFRMSNDNLRSLVVTPDKIYNEFSSGAQDASAIRDFVKMFYDRAGSNTADLPKYLLLFGDGSYDNIGYIKSNTNFIPTFESRNSHNQFGSYVSDDFFGLLDDTEGDWDYNPSAIYGSSAIDVAVGRLPVQNALQARQMVDKIIHYSNTATFGDWRNKYVLVADDQDNNLHFSHSENHYNRIKALTNNYNIDKIYLDAYQQMSTPTGNRYPEVNAAFNQRVNTGALVINYIGHGGENGLGHEKILTIDDINSWRGIDNMPVLVTATCSFSRWDDPLFQSAGELCLLNPNGGSIGMFTTTRIVLAFENESINASFIRALFDSTNIGSKNTLGDILKQSKNYNGLGLTIGQRNFSLLGDPSLPFATPKYNVVTESINNVPVGISVDTIKALKSITIKGYISDVNGNILNTYNGTVYPIVFDKKTTQKTLGQDKGIGGSVVAPFTVQKNIIYKGKASVQNGRFSFTFVVPKDINYNVGLGRINYYASLNNADANGSYDSILVGGSSNTVINDDKGPEMQVFLNSTQFANGGITNDKPVLIVKMRDDNGVNTVGNGIGHNITAKLTSGNKTETIDLNEFYEATLDSYQDGEIRYPFSKLEPGNYTLSVKAWDVVNNSSEISTSFTVIESKKFSIDKVYNYPNPFTTQTNFQFEHNRPNESLDVMVQIFTVSGKLVKTIIQNTNSASTRIDNIAWDGKDDFGDKLARGVYVYRLKARSSDGSMADKYEKLVILN